MPLTEKEKKELELLDNPDVQFLPSGWGAAFSNLFGGGGMKTRKQRVVELRTKIRMEENRLDKKRDRKEYNRIQEEEENNFDDKFKK
jgi:hypothetical protein